MNNKRDTFMTGLAKHAISIQWHNNLACNSTPTQVNAPSLSFVCLLSQFINKSFQMISNSILVVSAVIKQRRIALNLLMVLYFFCSNITAQPFIIDPYRGRLYYSIDPFTNKVYYPDAERPFVNIFNLPTRFKERWSQMASSGPLFSKLTHKALYFSPNNDTLRLFDFERHMEVSLARLPFASTYSKSIKYYMSISPDDKYLVMQENDSLYFMRNLDGAFISRPFRYKINTQIYWRKNKQEFIFSGGLSDSSGLVIDIAKYNIVTDSITVIGKINCTSNISSIYSFLDFNAETDDIYFSLPDCTQINKYYVHTHNLFSGRDSVISNLWPASVYQGQVNDLLLSPDYSKLVINSMDHIGGVALFIYDIKQKKITNIFTRNDNVFPSTFTWFNNDTLLYNSDGSLRGFYGLSLPGILNGIDSPTKERMSNYVLYPQPVYNNLTIQKQRSSSANVNLRVMNVLGEELYTLELTTDQTSDKITSEELNKFLTKLSAGVYFLQIKESNANEVSVKKFIKIK